MLWKILAGIGAAVGIGGALVGAYNKGMRVQLAKDQEKIRTMEVAIQVMGEAIRKQTDATWPDPRERLRILREGA